MVLAAERIEKITAMLRQFRRVSVSELREMFNVSEETIRRDLDKLMATGIARRTYGGALLNDDTRAETPYDLRKRSDVQAKARIATLVAGLIDDGDYIMLDESSTSSFIAHELKQLKGLTLITNSMEIVAELADVQGWNILCTGGQKRPSAPSFAGHQAENMVRSYHVDKSIISCGSLDIDAGFTDRHEDTALIKRAMMDSAKQVILAVDHTKFDRVAFATIGGLNRVSVLVTDMKPDERWLEAAEKYGIKIIY